MNKCQPFALGIAIGVLWSLYILGAGLVAMFGWSTQLVTVLGSLYLGYGPSVVGAIVGAVWAFVDGFIAGVVIAWVYNRVART